MRRVEVIRYTRGVTMVQCGSGPADSDGLPVIDIIPAAPEREDNQSGAGESVKSQKSQRRLAFRPRDLLRPVRRLLNRKREQENHEA
jgi:hypothetical protein